LDGTVVKSSGGRRFEVRCKGAPVGWKVELHTLRPEQIELGASGSFWVAKLSPLHRSLLVHDGDFGRMPISDAMRVRYVASLRALLSRGEVSADELADLRSFIARIEQRNHADWLTVWRALGEPETGTVKELLADLTVIKTARKASPENVPAMLRAIDEKYGDLLQSALYRLIPVKNDRSNPSSHKS
jgi:hypothetical protein